MMVTSINVDNFDTPLECLSRCVNIATKHFSSSRQGQFVNLLWFLLANYSVLFNAKSLTARISAR